VINSSKIKHNKLINEKSPYLIQHAYNPVEWYPWGEEAFKKASEENKPIFLSIGYSTCHWCHVMAHESFEDSEVAEILNEMFVSIKVDREERPDIDKIYMNVCQMLTGSGGWPLTIIMTPEKKPFFAGTYFPKTNRFGRIGLIDLILRIKKLWDTERDKIFSSAEKITLSLQNLTEETPGELLGIKTLKKAYTQLASQFDPKNGGFGNRPKFPTPHNLIFLLRYWKRTNEEKVLSIVEKTLSEMRKGGMFDHIGFGFHRYSTDSHWLVPHFEKMMYDQALLVMAYVEAYQATQKEEYAQTAREILMYVLRDMVSPEGGFYSAEDADSEGEEGKFYVWSLDEMKEVLNDDELKITKEVFDISKDGNYLDESKRVKTGKNILHLKRSMKELVKDLRLNEQELKNKIEMIRTKLFKERLNRVPPLKDDKILTDWNGLVIASLAKSSQTFSDPLYINAAKRAADFVLSNLRASNGRLLHRYRDGRAEIGAYLSDYAFFIWGLIELYEATFENKFLKLAIELNNDLIDNYWDKNIGGFYFTSNDGEELLTRPKETYDGAIPSGNSIALQNLLRLSYITGDHTLEEKAEILIRVFAEKIESNPIAYTQFMVAVDFAVGPSYSLVIAGEPKAKDTLQMLKQLNDNYSPNKVMIYRSTETYPPEIDKYSNFIEWFEKVNGLATAYVCINKTCKPPTNDPEKVLEYLSSEWSEK
jgi:uncharacterized protein YyaL (SSP411 family)